MKMIISFSCLFSLNLSLHYDILTRTKATSAALVVEVPVTQHSHSKWKSLASHEKKVNENNDSEIFQIPGNKNYNTLLLRLHMRSECETVRDIGFYLSTLNKA